MCQVSYRCTKENGLTLSHLESLLLFYFHLTFSVFFFSFHLLHCELYSELDNLIAMQNLRYSANKGSDDAYDVSVSLRASTTSGTTRATSTSPSTTPMTILTSTFAWCTPCVERARRAHSFTLDVVSHLIGSRSESCHKHLHSHP